MIARARAFRVALGIAGTIAAALLAHANARAATIVYGIHNDGIYTINTTNGASTALYTGAPFTGTASSVQGGAQRPSDGSVFFLLGTGADQQTYTYDPYSPATPPVLLGSTGASVQLIPRLAFDSGGTLWGVDGTGIIYTISQTTGVATATGKTVTGVTGSGGDFAIDSTGKWWFASGTLLYSLPNSNGGAATSIGTITTGSITGIAFGPGGVLYGIDNSVPSNVYSINTGSGAGTLLGATSVNDTNFGDLASIIAPDIVLTKTDNGPFTVGTNGTYTLTASNALGSAPTSGTVTVVDVLPTGIGYVSATGTGWTCGNASGTVTCTRTTAIATGAAAPAITITVSVSNGAYPSVSNTATATGTNIPTIYATDGTGIDTTTVNQQANSGTNLVTGPIDTTEATYKGANYTGSFDGIFAAGNNYDFTARSIPFAGGTVLTNTGTVPGTWIGNAISASSVTVDVPNMLYYTNPTNAARVLTLTPTAPSSPGGWTLKICPDNGTGTAGSGVGGNGPSTGCTIPGGAVTCPATPAANGWLTTGATATYCSRKGANGTFNVVYWAEYTTPSSGLVTFTRYDAYVTVADDEGTALSNITHDELYASFVPVTKSQTIVSNGCPAGVTPPAGGICAGGTGMIRYTLDFRNVMVGAGIGTEGQLLSAFLASSAGGLSVADDGVTGSNLGTYSNGLASVLVAGGTYTSCSATANTCGSSVSGTTFTGNTIGSTSFAALIGGGSFQLKPSGVTGATAQGTVIFAVTIK